MGISDPAAALHAEPLPNIRRQAGKWMSLLKTLMSSTQQDQNVDGESFSVSKTAKIDPIVDARDSLVGGVTLAIRGSCESL